MLFVWAGLLAAAAAWLLNGLLVKGYNTRGLIFLAPLLEEGVKTGSALLFGTSILLVHITFGLLEAAWDMLGDWRKGLYAGLAGLVGHTIFGLISTFLWQYSELVGLALAGGYVAHMAYNYTVLQLVHRRRND